jgi:hypothetical protein
VVVVSTGRAQVWLEQLAAQGGLARRVAPGAGRGQAADKWQSRRRLGQLLAPLVGAREAHRVSSDWGPCISTSILSGS